MTAKPQRRRKLIFIAVLIALGAAFFLWRPFGTGADIRYLTVPVRRGDLFKTVSATGEISARELVSVGAQVSGQIKTLAVELGQEVRKGDLIAEIDYVSQENELEINKARLATYEGQLAAR